MALAVKIQHVILVTLRLVLVIAGVTSLCLSSFAAEQFQETPKWKVLAVSTTFIVLVSAFVLIPPIYDQILANTNQLHFSLKSIINICILAFASTLIFLTKYPGFNIHYSEYMNTTGESIRGYQFNLYSAGAFAFLALIVSWERNEMQNMEFGVFNFLLELTMEASMDIPRQNQRGPSLWFMLGAGLYCCLLVFIRSYRDSLVIIKKEENNLAAVEREQQHNQDLEMNSSIPTSPRASFERASISTTHEEDDDDDDDATNVKLDSTNPLETNSVGGATSIILDPRSISKNDIGVQTDLPPGTTSIQEETIIVVEH